MIYIHIPYCHRKCTYCAFYSKPASGQGVADSFVDALLSEMLLRCSEAPRPVRTVYFGGGTPSLLSPGQLGRIVGALHKRFDLSQVEEVTLEANPEDLTPEYLQGLRTLGFINRLSVGLQSLDDGALRLIGRRHTARQAMDVVSLAARYFENITIDLIYGLPGQSLAGWEETLRRALRLPVKHLSAYSLTVEEGTALAVQVGRGRVALPPEDEVLAQYHSLLRISREAGFGQYEVSNFCLPGWHSRHNSRYWDRTPYLGLGPGAHSFDGVRRRWNLADARKYVAGLLGDGDRSGQPPHGEELLTPADAFNELLMTSLRTVRGLPLAAVPEEYKERLHRMMLPYIKCGWIEPLPVSMAESAYRPTAEGLLHADGMAVALFV